MESDDKLRLQEEIAHLSSLIESSSNGNPSPRSSVTQHYAPSLSSFSTRGRQFYPNRSYISLNRNNAPVANLPLSIPQYPNPFRYIDSTFVRKCFPDPLQRNTAVRSSPIRSANIGSSTSISSSTSGFHNYLVRNPQNLGLPDSHRNLCNNAASPASHSSRGSGAPATNYNITTNNTDGTGYAGFANITSTTNAGLEIQANRVRPHVNPNHLAFQEISKTVSSSFVTPVSAVSLTNTLSSSSSATNSFPIIKVDMVCDDAQAQNVSSTLGKHDLEHTSSSCTMQTKYKLDRRLQQSPNRRLIRAARFSESKVCTPKMKLFKRYSMRVVHKSRANSSSYSYQNFVKKSIAQAQKQLNNKYLKRPFVKPYRASSQSSRSPVAKGGKPKIIVRMGGSKFVQKSDGKSLKRIRPRNNSVVNISGYKFIRKNGGRTIRRLRESISLNLKPPQPPAPGIRLAHRALARSKLTLYQRTWKKKQFCVFYNRFGECKRKDKGCCPYIHDRKQLLICPRFVGGKCTAEECKLSHNLELGRMPPCQFFNKSQCARENCPYPHIKSSPVAKKSTKTGNGNGSQEDTQKALKSPRTRKSLSKKKLSPKKLKKRVLQENENSSDAKSRYYDQIPDTQPVIAIIPRRMPRENESTGSNGNTPKPEIDTKIPASSQADSANLEIANSHSVEPNCSRDVMAIPLGDKNEAETPATPVSGRRMRLMSKMSRLLERVKKNEPGPAAEPAPHFLPLS